MLGPLELTRDTSSPAAQETVAIEARVLQVGAGSNTDAFDELVDKLLRSDENGDFYR